VACLLSTGDPKSSLPTDSLAGSSHTWSCCDANLDARLENLNCPTSSSGLICCVSAASSSLLNANEGEVGLSNDCIVDAFCLSGAFKTSSLCCLCRTIMMHPTRIVINMAPPTAPAIMAVRGNDVRLAGCERGGGVGESVGE
jgi:hypothetical protein